MTTSLAPREGRHIVVIGAGGNIGSHLVPHLARNPEITRLTLVDPDRYEPHNVRNQAITTAAIGRSKVQVQAALARRINPGLAVRAIAESVEDAPIGRLRGDVILACVDSRRARQHVNEIAWHLGVPWIDAGVLRDGMMARIDLYMPSLDSPCLECRWDAPDYDALEQQYPCGAETVSVAGDTPSALGALAAAMQALECQQLLANANAAGALSAGDQIVLAAAHHRHLRTSHRRNPHCRLADHSVWSVEPIELAPGERTLGALVEAIESRLETGATFSLAVAGKHFVRKMLCPECGATQRLLRLSRVNAPSVAACPQCLHPMVVTGFGVTEVLLASALGSLDRARPLRVIGLRDAEIATVLTDSGRRHFEMLLVPVSRRAAAAAPTPAPQEVA